MGTNRILDKCWQYKLKHKNVFKSHLSNEVIHVIKTHINLSKSN